MITLRRPSRRRAFPRGRLWHATVAALALLAALARGDAARAEPEPLVDRLREQLKQDTLEVGWLLQVVADVQSKRRFGGENGFSIANARLKIGGRLDRGFSWVLQGNFVKQPALLDGKMSWRHGRLLAFDMGQFKAPFSHEYLVPASDIDFVDRSQGVTALAPGRQIGLQVKGTGQEGWSYALGVFNGNGIGANGNDGGGMMLVVRGGRVADEERPLAFGIDAAWSDDDSANLGSTIGGEPLLRGFEGTRLLAGADVRWSPGTYLLSAELIAGHLDPVAGDTLDLYGYHLTAGAFLGVRSQLLVRLDQLETDDLDLDSDLLLFGYNFWPSSVTELQANVVLPLIDFELDRTRIVANLQVSF